ncbi:MAG TPA: hypothetical protein VH583_03515 [Vicinamibacterales bacterium]|jgi:hypothetical protein
MLRRVRGLLLRFVRRRAAAVAAGLVLVIPSAWFEFGPGSDTWWVSGAALVCGASGLALIAIGLTGVSPDFIDTEGMEGTEVTEVTESSTEERRNGG